MMEHYLQRIETFFNSGDPEIRSWFLIRHNYWPFILCFGYALFSTVIGPAIMKNRKPFQLRSAMIIFNFSLVAAYTVVLSIIFWTLPKITFEQFCRGSLVKSGEPTYTLTRLLWWIYMLRYIEFFDTVFFVLRKKQNLITFLHVFHHFLVPILGWIVFRTERSGLQGLPVLLNAIVHVIMYSYYGLAAMGPSMRKYLWWKKYLTQLQMIQFSLIILFVTIIAPLSGCTMVETSYLMDIMFAPLFLYLFYTFYTTTFKKRSVPVTNEAAKNGETTNGVSKKMGESTNGVSKKMGESTNGVSKKMGESTNGVSKKMGESTNGVSKRMGVSTNGMSKKEELTNGHGKNGSVAYKAPKKEE